MNCNICNKEITDKNRKLVNGGLYKSNRCKPCYNKKIQEFNKQRAKALKEARGF